MKLPSFILPALLRLHAAAEATPYFHLPGYMRRFWILGARSEYRNRDNPNWQALGFRPPRAGLLYRLLCKHIACRAHTTLRSDSDRHLHDHPGWSASIVLEGGYWEVGPLPEARNPESYLYQGILSLLQSGKILPGPDAVRWLQKWNIHWRAPGTVVFRRATAAHRLILPPGTVCKSIFFIGRKTNQWGFYTPAGKVHWREYLGVPNGTEGAQ